MASDCLLVMAAFALLKVKSLVAICVSQREVYARMKWGLKVGQVVSMIGRRIQEQKSSP